MHAVKHGGITGNMAGGTHHAHGILVQDIVSSTISPSVQCTIEHLGVKRVAIWTWTYTKAMELQQFLQPKNERGPFLSIVQRIFLFVNPLVILTYPLNLAQKMSRTWKKSRKLSTYVLSSGRSLSCIKQVLMDLNTTISENSTLQREGMRTRNGTCLRRCWA